MFYHLLPPHICHLLHPLLSPTRHVVESMNLLESPEVVVEIQVVVESLFVGEFGLPSFVVLIVSLLVYVIQHIHHDTYLPNMDLFFEQIQIT